MTNEEFEADRWDTQCRMNGHISSALKSMDEIMDTLTARITHLENEAKK